MTTCNRLSEDAKSRAAAPKMSEAYMAGLCSREWFRWNGGKPSGSWELGADMKSACHNGLQVYVNGEWHPVSGFGFTTHAGCPFSLA